jgi:hypothetical protein
LRAGGQRVNIDYTGDDLTSARSRGAMQPGYFTI